MSEEAADKSIVWEKMGVVTPVLLRELLDALVEPCRRCVWARAKLAEVYQVIATGNVISRGEEDHVGHVIKVEDLKYDCPMCHNREVVLTPLGRRLAAILNVLGKNETDLTGKSEPVPF
jgi:hypothetical protein